MRGLPLLCFVVLGAACAPERREPPVQPAGQAEAISRALFAAFPSARPTERLVRAGSGFQAVSAPVSLPARSDGVARIASAIEPGAWLEVRPLDLGAVDAIEAQPGALVFRDAASATDVVWSAHGHGIEELRRVRTHVDVHRARYALRTSPGARVALVDGRVDVVDAQGRTLVHGGALEAVDARGTHRGLTASLEPAADGTVVLTVTLDAHDLEAPLAIDPAWTGGPAMTLPRADAQAVTLPDGRVLVIGGEHQGSKYTDTTEVYRPTTNTFASSGNGGGGLGAAVAVLASGKVLRAGGFTGLNPRKDAAVFDPASSAWSTVPVAFSYYMSGYAAAPISSNEFLVCGGTHCEIVNASTLAWSSVAAMGSARTDHTLTRLGDGSVLAVGGRVAGSNVATAERYVRATNTWTAVGSMKATHQDHTATLLGNGKVLVIGGGSKQAELFDPATNTWGTTGLLAYGRAKHSATLLADGRVLVAGGGSVNAEIYDPVTNTFGPGGALSYARSAHVAGRLPDGRVLVAGDASLDNSSEIWGRLQAQTCAADYECVNGNCVDGVCCATASCPAGYSCNLPGKVGTCAKANGATCAAASECASGQCVDGVCCNTSCTGQCSACNLAGKAGTCSAVVGAPVGGRAACGGAGAGTTCGAACDGSSLTACKFPSTSTSCGSDSCAAGVETRVGTCNGAGACSSTTKACGAYACGAKSCLGSCSTSTDCAAGFYCKGSECVPAEGLGKPCAVAGDCSTGFCTDGVCCGVGTCGLGSSCAIEGHEGTCSKKLATTCASDAECGSGFCVDGVCCESRCEGQCEACDVEGKVGRCAAVDGAPHGARPACSDGEGDVCQARVCKGSADTTACVGFASDGSTTCAPANCEGTTWTGASTCDGAGGCAAPKPTSCVPYRCGDAGCLETCETDAQCASGFACLGSRCEARAATCSEDRLSTVSADGATTTSCVPYRCLDSGDCGKTCKYSSECAPGYVCDPSSSTCTAAAAPTYDDGGGCALQTRGGKSASGAAAFLLLALAALRRRTGVSR